MTTLAPGFLWGAATAPHQVEGNNVNADFWRTETRMPGATYSGDACDSYHRYREDMQLMADAGLTAYRFGIEWARIQPRPDLFSRAELAHYRRMIDTALELGLTPVVTLHHFTSPAWFADEGGGLTGPTAAQRWGAYVERVTEILDGVEWIITFNEPNMLALMTAFAELAASGAMDEWQSPTLEVDTSDHAGLVASLPTPDPEVGRALIALHRQAVGILRARTTAKVGWTIANQAFTPTPGNEATYAEVSHVWEDLYLEGSAGDDFIGVQSYSSQPVDANGPVPHPPHPDNTLVGSAYRPDALGIALRHAWEVGGGIPLLVTENGIATDDDTRRIAYTEGALAGLEDAVADGIDVRGYLHWSLLDNYEWGHWEPTFGLIAVDRETFVRTPKPSLAWLGQRARAHAETAVGA
ncbi:family 1 glycosylhydrolase [Microbacterium sp. X-17]|uniref:glycoside hydrolase family 1 protein n=1 Tax=Microbacterium sp. X-17 TaxID=3144404 RepID=UPI0031F504A7